MSDSLPDYAAFLAAYHEAFAPELQHIIADLPLCTGDRARRSREAPALRFVSGNIAGLPFKDNHFDVAWCAQNLANNE